MGLLSSAYMNYDRLVPTFVTNIDEVLWISKNFYYVLREHVLLWHTTSNFKWLRQKVSEQMVNFRLKSSVQQVILVGDVS